MTYVWSNCRSNINENKLHSSRMRTARALTVSHSKLGGGGVSAPGGVCLLWWGLLLGVSGPGGMGVSGPGVSALGGVWSRGGVWSQGVCEVPPVNRITDACKNITLPQLRCGR